MDIVKPCYNKNEVSMQDCVCCSDFNICYKQDLEALQNEVTENE